MYCAHDGKASGELILRPFHARIVCERCGAVIKLLEASPVTRIECAVEMADIRALEPES